MPNVKEIEEALKKDETFLRLHQEDPELATKYAENAFKLADKPAQNQPATQQQSQGPVRTFVRPLLEGGGAIGGGIIGTGLGPAGTIAGGVLGAAGGSALADVAEQVAGEQPAPQTLQEAGQKTIENLQTGAISEVGGQTLNFAVKVGQKALNPLSHLIDPAKERVMRLAEEMGVHLSAGDITGSRLLSMFVEGIGERTPFSAGQIHDFRMEGIKKLVERRNQLLEKGGTPQAIEETGQRLQQRVQDLMDELGVTNQNMRRQLVDSTLERLGSQESFEVLGRTAQEVVTARLAERSARVGRLYREALDLAPPGSRIQPENLRATVQQIEERSRNTDPELMDPRVRGFLKQFKGSGNKAYDEQQAWLQEQLANVPDALKPRAREIFLEGRALEEPGYNPQELNALRIRLNTAIDELDAGLKLSGQAGVKGVGKSGDNVDKTMLLDLKRALDADIASFSTQHGGELQAGLDIARLAAGNFKSFSNSNAVKALLKARPQEAARMLAQSKDLQGIRMLRNTMGQEFRHVEDALSNEILGVGKEGLVTPASIRNQLNQYKKGVAEAMLGPGKANQLRALANQLESLDSAAVDNPFFKRLLKASPDRVVDYIVKPNNTVNIRAVRDRLGEEAVRDLARGMTNKILRKPDFNVPEEEFLISPAKLLSGLKKLGDDTLNELFRHDPKFLQEIKELSEVANASQGAARASANPSGTGQSLIAFGELTMTMYNPMMGLRVALGIPAVTKLYLSPLGRKWLTTGFKTNPNSPEAAKVFGKIMGLVAAGELRNEREAKSLSGPPFTIPERQASSRPGPIALNR